jgi:hypothetical protein
MSGAAASWAKPWWAVVAVAVEVVMLSAVNLQHVRTATGAAKASQDAAKSMLTVKDFFVSLLAVVPAMLQVMMLLFG